MTLRQILAFTGTVLVCLSSCKKDEKLACVDVAAAVKKWADVSIGEGSAEASRAILEACSAGSWSEGRKRCVVAAFGEAEPMDKFAACEEGEGNAVTSDYSKKSKTAEASVFLKKMSDSARTYYETPELGSVDSLIPSAVEKHMPASAGPTPPLGTCCENGGRCSPTSGDWDSPTWQALDFEIRDPHYYSYEFKTEGTGADLSFTALAYGDLDCDGDYSTFSLYGAVMDGELQSAGDVLKVKALE